MQTSTLKVVIVGAGIGGLTAALALRQQGHEVTLLESSNFRNEIGAAINIPPYCDGVLKRLGIDLNKNERLGSMECTGCTIWAGATGEKIISLDYYAERSRWQHLRRLVHRAHLHSALWDKAISTDGPGKPCTLRLGSKVALVDPNEGEAILETGERVSGDLIIGADGVHSQCRKALEGGPGYVPFDSGISAFRFLIPTQVLQDDPITREIIKGDGSLAVVMGTGVKRLVCYPCAGNTMINCIYLHPSSEYLSIQENWQDSEKQLMLHIASEFSRPFKSILEKAPENDTKIWVLLDLPVLPTWSNGKMALLGDAAHPFLPHRGEGAAQAIEDGVSLGALLPRGTTVEEIPERLALYEKCRKERATTIQDASRLNSEPMDVQRRKGFSPHEFDNYSFSHDEFHHSTHVLQRAKRTKEKHGWYQPISFGPSASPCRFENISSSPGVSPPWKTVHSIRFSTSKTYLEGLLPTESFSFALSDTVVQASWICTSFRNLPWLSGLGYDRVGLYIHGIQYTSATGEIFPGTFVPILFENMPDAVLSGRDERGAPVLSCDIEILDGVHFKTTTLSWRETTFGRLHWNHLEADDEPKYAQGSNGLQYDILPKPHPDLGLLTYRYVPAVGQPGKADAAYAVFEAYENTPLRIKPNEAENENHRTEYESSNGLVRPLGSPRKQHAHQASFHITAGDDRSIPTLHHITQILQDMPVYGILEGNIETIQTGDGYNQARRID